MGHVHQEARVSAPVEHVFALACNVDRHAEWDPYMDVRNYSGPVDRVGTTFDSTMRLAGQTIESKGTVVEAEPLRLIRIRGIADNGSTSDWVYRFERSGEGTVCSVDVDYEMPGVVAAVIDRLVFHRALERAARHMSENFAALAEEKVPQTV